MMQSALIRIADIHSGALPDRFQAFEFVDLRRVILLRFVDAGGWARTIFFARIFVLGLDSDGGSGWHRKKVSETSQKTPNNLVVSRVLFPLHIGVRTRPDATILRSAD